MQGFEVHYTKMNKKMAMPKRKRLRKVHYPTLYKKPTNLFLLPVIVLLNYNVTAVEIGSGIYLNSLSFFTHGLHSIINSIILSILTISSIINWERKKRYSIFYAELGVKIIFATSIVYSCLAIFMMYLSARSLIIQPLETQLNVVFSLIPFPGLLLNFVSIFVISSGYGNLLEQSAREQESVDKVCHHLFANASASIGVIITSALVHDYECAMADPICSLLNATLMLLCALSLMKDTFSRIVTVGAQASIFTISSCIKNDVLGLTNMFHV